MAGYLFRTSGMTLVVGIALGLTIALDPLIVLSGLTLSHETWSILSQGSLTVRFLTLFGPIAAGIGGYAGWRAVRRNGQVGAGLVAGGWVGAALFIAALVCYGLLLQMYLANPDIQQGLILRTGAMMDRFVAGSGTESDVLANSPLLLIALGGTAYAFGCYNVIVAGLCGAIAGWLRLQGQLVSAHNFDSHHQ